MKHNINGKRASSNDELMRYLDSVVKEGDSILDLGCGPKLYSDPFKDRCSKIITIDAWESVNPDFVADLETVDLNTLLGGEKFDYVLMIDFIEHLDKDAGIRLLDSVKTLTTKKIVLLTPLEEIWDDNHKNVNDPRLWCYGNTFDIHKSLWHKEDFTDWTPLDLPSLCHYFVGVFPND